MCIRCFLRDLIETYTHIYVQTWVYIDVQVSYTTLDQIVQVGGGGDGLASWVGICFGLKIYVVSNVTGELFTVGSLNDSDV